ncbi:MAG: hypothetical protein IKL07_01415 [Clostridium sp.]|nr:hypothetical protein [Clostridium sp.]
MSDLSSNSMTREELIQSARANCMRQIDKPQASAYVEHSESAEIRPFKKGTYIRLFLSCLLLLCIVSVKQFGLSYKGYDFSTIVEYVTDSTDFEKLQYKASETLKDDVIPAFTQIKSHYFWVD